MSQSPIYFLVGPTAVGKSSVALAMANRLDAEIISCDALQVYREVNIASDKPTSSQRTQIPHHLIDVVSVTEDFNVARWRQLAVAAIDDIQSRGKKVLIVGGSGMYMSVLLDGIFEGITLEEDLKQELEAELAAKGAAELHSRLVKLDPQAAAKIHPNDPQRLIRALAVIQSTGKPISQLQSKREGLWGKMPMKLFALSRPREELYQKVETRIEAMFAQGLIDEVSKISALPLSATAAKLIGVPEVRGYLNGEYDLERAKYLMKLHTRHYVKRQLTWFRGDDRLTWIDITPDQSPAQITDILFKSI